MRLGVNLLPGAERELALQAERLGYDAVLAPEGYRDAITVLSWVAGQTARVRLVAGVCQIPGRTPVLAATTAATLNALSGGRFALGLGVSNAHTSDSWHGQPFDRPLGRTREYVAVVRSALAGDPVVHAGEHLRLPRSAGTPPFRMGGEHAATPVLLAATGERALVLAGEVADGWIGSFCSAERVTVARRHLATGHARRAVPPESFEVLVTVPLAVGDDVAELAAPVGRYAARFLSLGHRAQNPYFRLADAAGFGAAAACAQDRFLTGDVAGAVAALPLEFLDAMAVLGPPQRVRRRIGEFAAAGVTTLCVGPLAGTPRARAADLELAAAAVEPAS